MKSGYDQFFKQARKNATGQAPVRAQPKSKINFDELQKKAEKKEQINSQDLAKALRQRMRPQVLNQKRRSRKTPFALITFSILGVVGASLGLHYHEDIYHIVKKVEIGILSPAAAETAAPAASSGAEAAKPAEPALTDKKEFTQEEINHFGKLNERKRELDAREEELNRMETEITAQKVELEKRLADLETTRQNISKILEERVEADAQKVDTLVQMYSNMKPAQAAKVFETMDEDLAVEILGKMKKKNAAEIMNLIKPEKAQVFSEKYAGYKRNQP
ncbi:MAG: hypothetical protein LW875_12390 [Proteobacteria bacterium]|jgi:flagellar motility protein MotE (MotC chaperone)|nr:hypothetical protein [Pseudomonadota bacterium]